MKYKQMRKIVKKLPQQVWKDRRDTIKGYCSCSKEELEQKVEESLCRQLKILMTATILFLVILIAMAIYWFGQNRQIVITRNEKGGQTKEEILKIKTGSETETYHLSVQPEGYKKQDISQVLENGEKYLQKNLKKKNISLNQVTGELYMPEKIPGENIEILWESSDLTVIDQDGNVFSKNVKKPVIVWLHAHLICQGEKKVVGFPVCVLPGNEGKKKSKIQMVKEQLKKEEASDPSRRTFTIPETVLGATISKGEKENQFPLAVVFGVMGIAFLWYRENQKYKQKYRQAEDESRREYPEIISRFVLYLETGLSVPAVMEHIFREYEMKKMKTGKEIFVYEQIGKALRQMEFGLSQTEVFKNLGKSINISVYRKFSLLLTQSITKGSSDLFYRLREEEEAAFKERKEQAKRSGEEASTRLLAPMMIMLIIILVLLMFPALASFS